MAKEETNELDDIIESDLKNITEKFFRDNRDIINEISEKAGKRLAQYGQMSRKKTSAIHRNPLEELQYNLANISRIRPMTRQQARQVVTDSRYIDSTRNKEDSEIIQTFTENMNNAFALMDQYEKAMQLIPELNRVIKIMVRDIRNPGEFDKKSLAIQFENNSLFNLSDKTSDHIISKITDHITKKYGLETKTRSWIDKSLVTGAKPVAVFSYVDILKSIYRYDESAMGNSTDVSFEEYYYKESEAPSESFEEKLTSLLDHVDESFESVYSLSEEDTNVIFDHSELNVQRIINDEVLAEWTEESLSEMKAFFTESNQDIDSRVKENYTEYFKKFESSQEADNFDKLREKLSPLVEVVNNNIKIVTPDMAAIASARDTLRKRLKYKTNKNGEDEYIDALVSESSGIDNRDRGGPPQQKSVSNRRLNAMDIAKEAIIIEYDPEMVIPVNIGSEHIGYYVIECDSINKQNLLGNKYRKNMFLDIVSNSGLQNDVAMNQPTPGFNGDSLMSSPFFDPRNSISSLVQDQAFTNISNSKDSTRKIDILKKIVLRTLAIKLKSPSLMEDKVFKDSVINLIRDGFLIEKSIKFTFIPADKMVYYSPGLNEDGLPVSILHGTLYYIYLYLMAIMSNNMVKLMKSENKEKLLLNMGMNKQFYSSLSEIQRTMTTRSVNMEGMFSNISSIFKNAGSYQRFIIPIFNGNQLFDIEGMQNINDITIDDEYTQNLLNSILTSIGVSPAILDMMNEPEFSRLIVAQHVEYRNSIVDKQGIYDEHNTKLIRLLISKTGLIKEIANDIRRFSNGGGEEIDKKTSNTFIDEYNIIKAISVKYNPPMYLNISNITEMMSTVEEIVDKFATIMFDEDQDNDIHKTAIFQFKKDLYKKFMNVVNWQNVEETAKDARESASEEVSKNKRDQKLSDGMSSGDDSGGGGSQW